MTISRNAPCPCGSGKRYKDCCGAVGRVDAGGAATPPGGDGGLRELMHAALAAQKAGNLDEAQRLYRGALKISPDNVDALHMLGVVHFSKGEFQLAEKLIAAAEALSKGTIPAISYNLSLVRYQAAFLRGEKAIRSMLDAADYRRRMGLDVRGDAVVERTTRLIAFYLPQFHRIAENDLWWGEGFTEWVNVRRAWPNFKGHYQPHEPGEMGYYDLADERVLERQAALAKEYGISGFCFYYYWFSGRRLLEMPIDRLLRTGKPDFPYCLCWANENWSRNWDGGNRDLLVEQRYLPGDPERFILDVLPHFQDHRYIRVGNRPLLMVYRVGLIPDPVSTFKTWRAVCQRNGMAPPYIVIASTFEDKSRPGEVGADAVSEFPPHGANVNLSLRAKLEGVRPEFKGHLVGYLQNIANFLDEPERDHPFFPGIVPSWDNTARRQNDGLCMLDSTPAAFELWLRELIQRASLKPDPEQRIVFINAWNEWAEGCHLEPDKRYGRAWLEACLNARSIPRDYQPVFGARGAPAAAPISVHSRDLPVADLERPQQKAAPPDAADSKNWVVTLYEGGDSLGEAPLLWRDALPERIVRDHEEPLVAPAVEVFCVLDAVLHGPGWVSTGDAILFDPSIYPTYCRDRQRERRVYNQVDAELSRLAERRYRAIWHASHFNCGVYGHWLTEMMPKLLVIREFLRRWPGYATMPLLLPSIFPEFVYAYTQALLPCVPIVTYDPRFEYIRTERVFMPTWGIDHVYHPWIGDEADRLHVPKDSVLPRSIFVSRRVKSNFRDLENLAELEEIAVQEGLTVIHPETQALERQVALFRGAALVVGEFGSALHNAIFSPRNTTIIALNWINVVQSRIARLRGHRIGYVLPTSGTAVCFEQDAEVRRYTIDSVEFRAKLREATAGLPAGNIGNSTTRLCAGSNGSPIRAQYSGHESGAPPFKFRTR